MGHQNFVFVVAALVRWRAFDLHFFCVDFGVFCVGSGVDLGGGRTGGGLGFIKQMCMKIYARIRAQ